MGPFFSFSKRSRNESVGHDLFDTAPARLNLHTNASSLPPCLDRVPNLAHVLTRFNHRVKNYLEPCFMPCSQSHIFFLTRAKNDDAFCSIANPITPLPQCHPFDDQDPFILPSMAPLAALPALFGVKFCRSVVGVGREFLLGCHPQAAGDCFFHPLVPVLCCKGL